MLIILIPLFYLVFTSISPGLIIETNLDLKTNPKITILIQNNSFHVINNLIVYLNDKNVKNYNSLSFGTKEYLEYPALTDIIKVKIIADNQLPYEQEFAINNSNNYNNSQDIITFKPSFVFRTAGKVSDINMNLCNIISEKLTLNIDIFADIEDSNLQSNNASEIIDLDANDCKTLEYHIVYLTTGYKKVTFKIYNDVYSKELLISGTVN